MPEVGFGLAASEDLRLALVFGRLRVPLSGEVVGKTGLGILAVWLCGALRIHAAAQASVGAVIELEVAWDVEGRVPRVVGRVWLPTELHA